MAANCKIYTPQKVVKEMLLLCGYKGKKILKKYVVDNSCGKSAILSEIVEEYIKTSKKQKLSNEEIKNDLETYIHGFDLDQDAIEFSKKHLQEIADKNGLEEIKWNLRLVNYLEHEEQSKYDYIIGNPPYISYYDMKEEDRQKLKVFDSC